MRWLYLAVLAACFALASCRSGTRAGDEAGAHRGRIVIYSTTDRSVFEPVIEDFRKLHTEYDVSYFELDAQPLYDRFLKENVNRTPSADIVLSSAVDLQVKLVNDGFAQDHRSLETAQLPQWARWREELFGLTFEPVVMVINRAVMQGAEPPKTRLDLVQMLLRDPERWRGKLGTYDITRSHVGYFLAAQDARLSAEYGALVGAFGRTHSQTYSNLSTLLDDLEAGRIAIGYNVLGSYAKFRIDAGAKLEIVYPADYTLALVRAAFISRNAPNAEGAHAFLDYLLSLRGQEVLAMRSNLAAVRSEIRGPYGRLGISGSAVGPLRPIPIGPGLMTYIDQQKRERFLRNWRTALQPEQQRDSPRQGYDSHAR